MEYVLKFGVLFVVAITELFDGALLSVFNVYEIQSLKSLYLLLTLAIYLTTLMLFDPKRRADRRFPARFTVFLLLCFIGSLSLFVWLQQTRTFDYKDFPENKPFRLVRGIELSDSGRFWAGDNPTEKHLADVLAKHGGPANNAALWEADSYGNRKFQLLGSYLIVILCYALFMSLLSLALSSREKKMMLPLDKAKEAAEESLLERFKQWIKPKQRGENPVDEKPKNSEDVGG